MDPLSGHSGRSLIKSPSNEESKRSKVDATKIYTFQPEPPLERHGSSKRLSVSGNENKSFGKMVSSFFNLVLSGSSKAVEVEEPTPVIARKIPEGPWTEPEEELLQRKIREMLALTFKLKEGFDKDKPIAALEDEALKTQLIGSFRSLYAKPLSEVAGYFYLHGTPLTSEEETKGGEAIVAWLFAQEFPDLVYRSLNFNAFYYANLHLVRCYPSMTSPRCQAHVFNYSKLLGYDIGFDEEGSFAATQRVLYELRIAPGEQEKKAPVLVFELHYTISGNYIKKTYSAELSMESITLQEGVSNTLKRAALDLLP